MKPIYYILPLISLSLCFSVFAEKPRQITAKEIISGLEKLDKSVKTFSAQFEVSGAIKNSGIIYIKFPSSARLEMQNSYITVDGDTVMSFSVEKGKTPPENKGLSVTTSREGWLGGEGILIFLKPGGISSVFKGKKLRVLKETDTAYRFKTAIAKGVEITCTLRKTDFMPVKWEYYSPAGNAKVFLKEDTIDINPKWDDGDDKFVLDTVSLAKEHDIAQENVEYAGG